MSAKQYFVTMAAAALLLPAFTQGCSSTVGGLQDAACCKEFQAGATIDAKIGGNAQSQVAVQAIADFSGIASAAVDDITGACRTIAQDLDVPKADADKAEQTADKQKKMQAWCGLAVTAIGTVKGKAGGSLAISIVVDPPKCEASISAKANCQAKCSGSASCDLKANPPTCEGGKLEVSCKGECTASAGASVACEGSCSGSCSGSCTAQGGVECSGKCEGTCEASASGGGSGIQADGTCKGTCKGTCSVTAPSAQCSGSCKGSCSASCKATANASVKCDGKCSGEFEPLKCTGGELKGGCKAEAKCEGSCDASVSAKAECTPPQVKLAITGGANAEVVAQLKTTLEANLPVVYALKARLEGMAKLTGTITANGSAVVDIKAACIPAVIAAAGTGVSDTTATVSATGSLIGSIK
jgi:hypothetical protein